MSRYVLALDQGTTSSRSVLIDHAGSLVAMAQQEFPQHFPHPGWVEHDPEQLWQSQVATIRAVMASAGARYSELAAVGISNQRETTLLWDKASGLPLARAIVWQDRRTAPLCQQLREAGHEADISARTGLLLDPYFSATKLAWLFEHLPGARSRAERGELAFGTVDTWLIWKLSGGRLHLTEPSNASRTLLCNLHTGIGTMPCCTCLAFPAPACRGSCLRYSALSVRASQSRVTPLCLARSGRSAGRTVRSGLL